VHPRFSAGADTRCFAESSVRRDIRRPAREREDADARQLRDRQRPRGHPLRERPARRQIWDGSRIAGHWFADHSTGGLGAPGDIVWGAYLGFGENSSWRSEPNGVLASGSDIIDKPRIRVLTPFRLKYERHPLDQARLHTPST
jgi:hypothetical protein